MTALTKKILIINGPNLNMLGTREPEIYGAETLADIEERCNAVAESLGLEVEFFQSNSEGEIIDAIHGATTSPNGAISDQNGAVNSFNGLIINAGGYTHTSVAIHDALKLLTIPVIELHISNVYKREEFRHKSLISPVATGIICGLGVKGYELALKSFL